MRYLGVCVFFSVVDLGEKRNIPTVIFYNILAFLRYRSRSSRVKRELNQGLDCVYSFLFGWV